jgi:hypothetical protein
MPSRTIQSASSIKRRSRQRGAAMTESLILIPVLIIVDVALMYMHSAYDTRLQLMRASKNDAWSYSIAACEGPSGTSAIAGESDGSLSGLQGAFQHGKMGARGSTLGAPFDPNLPIGSSTLTKGSASSNTVDTFQSLTMTSRSRVLCNEVQEDISEGDKRQTINGFYGQLL